MLASSSGARIGAALLGAVLLGWGIPAQAQVGLTSGLAQVSLVAHAREHGSLPAVSPSREIARNGSTREMATTVHLTANAAHRLVIRRAPGATTRVWVKSEAGSFQELTSHSAVTVDREDEGGAGRERTVYFRVDAPGVKGLSNPLPVLYELVINPSL